MKNYLIVGASSGIGRQILLDLAQSGRQVFGTYFNNATDSHAPSVQYHYLNILEEHLNFDFLPDTIDGLVYCPGSISLRPFHRIRPEEFVADYQLQVVGAIKVIQAILPRLKKSPYASIVLFSTVAVQSGFNFHTLVAASKGAIEGLTKSLAAELAPSVRVNCIAPSLTDTPLAGSMLNTPEKRAANAQRHPLKKIGTATDIANISTFLLDEQSGWITGQVFHVDGGMSTLKV